MCTNNYSNKEKFVKVIAKIMAQFFASVLLSVCILLHLNMLKSVL